jgi:hypothetical protein
MEDDSLHKRGNALESQFFNEVDRKLIEKLRSDLALESQRDRLKASTGLKDDAVLDELLALGINDDTMSALSLFPLIWVAWADGSVEPAERAAVLRAAMESGVSEGSPAMEMLSGWLKKAPGEDVTQAWVDYIHALKASASPETVERVKQSVLQRAHEVADAAGGFLGMGRVSAKESGILQRLEQAFE